LHRCVHGCADAEGSYENGNTAKEVEEPAVHEWQDTLRHGRRVRPGLRDAGHANGVFGKTTARVRHIGRDGSTA
jgi:DNA topoisomerase IB